MRAAGAGHDARIQELRQAAGLGALPELAARLPQHSPVPWVLGTEDPQAKRGEGFACAKAPPHPHSRHVTVKADRKGTPHAAAKAALEWIKALDRAPRFSRRAPP